MCGNSYDQVHERLTTDYLLRVVEAGKTIQDCQRKRQAFLAGAQCGAVTFIPRGVSQAATCDGIVYTINDGSPDHEAKGKFLLLFQN